MAELRALGAKNMAQLAPLCAEALGVELTAAK